MTTMETTSAIGTSMMKESIFNVTFTDGGEVFIQATDEAHVRRIIGKNDLWRTDTEGVPFSRTIEKIEESK